MRSLSFGNRPLFIKLSFVSPQIRPKGILERLAGGECVVGDGGMTFALERRGYVKAGVWTPECTVENPEAGPGHKYSPTRAGRRSRGGCMY